MINIQLLAYGLKLLPHQRSFMCAEENNRPTEKCIPMVCEYAHRQRFCKESPTYVDNLNKLVKEITCTK